MITVQPYAEWEDRQCVAIDEEECDECCGTGECPCCERECLECHGSGFIDHTPNAAELYHRYFTEVMDSLKHLCAFSSHHDFLTEAGDFIKANGRLDLPPWQRHRTIH